MNVEILKMSSQDFEEIKDLLTDDFDTFWNENILKEELLNTNSYYLVAKSENMILGFGGILQILDEATLTNIVVRKDYRENGIASSILENLIDYTKNNDASFITLEVNINNLPAIHLYKKYGFEQVGVRKKYYNNKDNALLMTKILN